MQRLGRYVLEGELGRGAMGVVFRARDPRIDRVVALKALRPDAAPDPAAFAEVKQRFLNEAKAAGRLSHPNIVTVHDAGEDEATGTAYMAMEFVPGVELKELLKTGVSREKLLTIVDGIAGALDHAHSRGVVHRDVKPANILLDEEGRARLTDFGIARLAASTMTQDGAFLGSPAYMSPEQVRSQEITGKSDVFSLGVVIFECLTGRRPFVGADLVSTTHAIANEQPQRPSELQTNLPPDVDEVLQAALAKDPADRPATATELARRLRAALEGGGAATLVAGRPVGGGAAARPSRKLLLGGLAALALLAIAVVLAIALGGESEPVALGGPVARVEQVPPPPAEGSPSSAPAPGAAGEAEPVAERRPEAEAAPVAAEPGEAPAGEPAAAAGQDTADPAAASATAAMGALRIELFTFHSGVLEVLDGESVVARQSVAELERKRGFRLKNPKRRFELTCEVPAGRRMLSFRFQVEGGELLRHRAVKDLAEGGTLPVVVDIGTLGRDIDVRFP